MGNKKDCSLLFPDEIQVWKDFKEGNKHAFSYIYNNYFNVLYNYGCKVIADKDVVKDCIQDLFFELWKSKEKLSDTDSIKFYLIKAVRIKMFKELKKKSKFFNNKNGLPEGYDFNMVPSREKELIDEQLSIEQKDKLTKVLTTLSNRQKEAIFLRYFDDLNYEEIASVMSINHQSVHNLIHRAMKTMRGSLISELVFLLIAGSIL